jgi:DhnA family fructose-bisphosphate aldolase class Ia
MRPAHSVLSSTAAGKERRFGRLFRTDGRSVMVAMDHGGFQGYGPPTGDSAGPVAAGKPDGVLGNWHLARSAAGMFAGSGLVLRVDGGTSNLGAHGAHDLTGLLHHAEAALTVGADAVAVMAYPGSADEHVSLVRLAQLCTECDRLGIPVMAEVVPGGFAKSIPWSVENISRGARIAAELGADLIKTMCPPDPADMAEVVASCPVPVVALGGPKVEAEDAIIDLARAVTKAGAAGIIFGRNVWGSADPGGLLTRLHEVVHGDG